MNKFIKTISLSLLLGLSFSSCEDVLDDNVNPDKAYYNNTEQAFPVIMFYASQIVYDHTEYNVYLSQCLTTMSKAQTGTGYPYKCGWEFLTVNRHPQWRRVPCLLLCSGRQLRRNILRTARCGAPPTVVGQWGNHRLQVSPRQIAFRYYCSSGIIFFHLQ